MEVESIPVEGIRCGNRLRSVSPERVEALAGSMADLGLRTPISVRVVPEFIDPDGAITDDVPILIAGLHRLEAAKKLGWDYIDAFVMDGDERDFRLWEIAENLHRNELTVQERAEHIAEWVRITGEKQNIPQLGEKSRRGRPSSTGVSEASRVLPVEGKTDKARQHNIERAIEIASLSPEAKEAAREAGIDDNQSVLLRVARETDAAHQLAAIKRERDAAEEHKRNRESDRVIALTEAQQFAEWLMERCDVHELPMLISWVECCKPKDVTTALRRKAA